jgi:glycosyltransferase involved in cell wall biosynthesis
MSLIYFPKVSIGLPVFNGGGYLERVLLSLVTQDYPNYEIIVSDNASQDCTEELCKSFAAEYSNFLYYRQSSNIGDANNFEFVLRQSAGVYFMWSAADDIRSSDFLSECVQLLELNPHAVAATGRDRMFDIRAQVPTSSWRTFQLSGPLDCRLYTFLDNIFQSNGIFYSLVRIQIAKAYNFKTFSELGGDWFFIIDLISSGDILRSKEAFCLISDNGISNSNVRWSAYRHELLGWLLPFYQFSLYTMKRFPSYLFHSNMFLLKALLRLNLQSAKSQFLFELGILVDSIRRYMSKEKKHRRRP